MQRVCSSTVAAFLLVALLPLFLVISIAVKCGSSGPVIFRQTRIGYQGRPFTIFKFRTMYHGSGNPFEIIRSGDARVTRIGRWLREAHLDELLQLWNIVRGDMRFVGPRPMPRELTRCYIAMYPGFEQRFLVHPGLTGPQQILGREWLRDNMEKSIGYEIAYVWRRDLVLDAYILWRTLGAVFGRQGV